MSTDEFNRKKFKIQDTAIRNILDILISPNLGLTKQNNAADALKLYNENLKKLYTELDDRRYD